MSLPFRSLLTVPLLVLAVACAQDAKTMADTDADTEAATTGRPENPDSGATTGITDGDAGTTSAGSGPNTSASDGEQNLPEGEGCCDAHRGPGCNEPDVVECVCAVDVACCGFDWNQSCVELAQQGCDATCQAAVTAGGSDSDGSTGGDPTAGGSTGGDPTGASTTGGTGECCDEQATPGCEDTAVEDCTCDLDPYCCDTAWDDVCIEQAVEQCMLICPG